jgi:Fic family protein
VQKEIVSEIEGYQKEIIHLGQHIIEKQKAIQTTIAKADRPDGGKAQGEVSGGVGRGGDGMTQPVQYHYGKFPPVELDWKKLIPLIGPTNVALARYDGTLNAVPNPYVLLSPLATQEAVLSSKIEGTVTTITEVMKFEAEGTGKSPEKVADIREVLNYRKAMWHAVDALKDLPLCQRVIRETHKILLEGVRGKDKVPGEYRRGPNWIGRAGCKVEEARFVPISVDRLPDGMGMWEEFIHEKAPDQLVKLAILHAEFEALHPFMDGNGRIGRMFVPLFLFKSGILTRPTFYISEFLEKHRDEYYERLLAVSRDGAWTEWCEFFLTALAIQSEINQQKASAILKLYETQKQSFTDMSRSPYAIHAMDFLFCSPIFRATTFTQKAKIPEPTAKRILRLLLKEKMLRTLRKPSGRRSGIYAFKALLNIVEGKEMF